jgi:hypothetical protein
MAHDALDREKDIFIKLGTQVRIEIGGVATRLKGILVGIEEGDYLLIKIHNAIFAGIEDRLFKGNQIIVRYIDDGTVSGFSSKLIKATLTPIKLLYIEHPKTIENFDLRSQERVDCYLPASIAIGDEEHQGAILDISERGCCYLIRPRTGERLLSVQIGEHITMRCQFPGLEGEQRISGNVRNFSMDRQETALRIEFHEINPELQHAIAHYISAAKELP